MRNTFHSLFDVKHLLQDWLEAAPPFCCVTAMQVPRIAMHFNLAVPHLYNACDDEQTCSRLTVREGKHVAILYLKVCVVILCVFRHAKWKSAQLNQRLARL